MINAFISAALKNEALMLANRVAPLVSASILLCYVFRGRTIGIITLSDEQSEAIVKARNGGELSPLDNWRKYFWGGGGN